MQLCRRTDPTSSELRRGYFQFVNRSAVLKFNKQIAEQRAQISNLIDARTKAGPPFHSIRSSSLRDPWSRRQMRVTQEANRLAMADRHSAWLV